MFKAQGTYRGQVANCLAANSILEGAVSLWNSNCFLVPQRITGEHLRNSTCSSVLLKPVSIDALVHTATINSTHISILADRRIKAAGIIVFHNIVLWMVLCQICGALAESLTHSEAGLIETGPVGLRLKILWSPLSLSDSHYQLL